MRNRQESEEEEGGGDPLDADDAEAFGINVNVFWATAVDAEWVVLGRALRSGGVLRLVYGGPEPGAVRDVGRGVAANLERQGFTTEVIRHPTTGMLCVVGIRGPVPG